MAVHQYSVPNAGKYILHWEISLEPWLVLLNGLCAGLQTKGLPVWFPVKAQAWAAGQVPSRGCENQPHVDIWDS